MATKWIEMSLARKDPERCLGLGWIPRKGHAPDVERFVGRVKMQLGSPTYNLPTIESVRIHFGGPIAPNMLEGFFGTSIDPFGASRATPPPGAQSVETTFATPGQLQTFGLVCAVGWHCEPEPMVWTTTGNAMLTPTTGTTKPISPDVFTGADGLTILPAVLDYALWQEQAFFHMARAYNLIWQFGSRTNLVRDSLRYTMYVPSNAQDGSASNSEIATAFFIQQMNSYYVSQFASPYVFLTMDRVRVGGTGSLNDNTGASSFRSFRNDLAPATHGGAGVRAYLRGNTDFRKLAVPYLLKPGVPIGLRADVSDSFEQTLMQQWLSASFAVSTGVVPAALTDFTNINMGAGAAAPELQLDNTIFSETTLAQRLYFKGGPFKVTCTIKGFELTDDQAESLRDVDLSMALQTECGMQMAA
jgi:hypothetical protein